MDTPTINVEHVLVCDDIRQERSGKYILIGVYTGSIRVPKFPAPLMMALWLDAQVDLSSGPASLWVRAVLRSQQAEDEQLFIVGGELAATAKAPDEQHVTYVPVPPQPGVIARAGEIVIQWRMTETDEWIDVGSLRAELDPNVPQAGS